MRKTSLIHHRSNPKLRSISLDLKDFIKKQYPTKIPVAFVTSISKVYSKNKPTTKDSKILKRFSESSNMLNTVRFIDYIST